MSGTTGESDELKMPAASNNEEDQISELLSQQNIRDLSSNDNGVSACANCGKEGSNLNICNKCKEATYCNAACKKKHRSKHKKQCERRVAELHDEALFGEPPPQYGDCPICFLRLPSMDNGRSYMSCCGKIICMGCIYAPVYNNQGKVIVTKKCPFCRTPVATSEKEFLERNKKRMEVGDAYAFYLMGCAYDKGEYYGVPQDSAKAIEFWHKAGKFGYTNLGTAYYNGEGAERDEQVARHYDELAAKEGEVLARHNLGAVEYKAGNYDRALKHFVIAVRGGSVGGDTDSVKAIQQLYMNGHVAKDHYANALQSHQAYINEIKSPQRDEAAAFREYYRYY